MTGAVGGAGVDPGELVPAAVDVVAVAVRESATVATTSLR